MVRQNRERLASGIGAEQHSSGLIFDPATSSHSGTLFGFLTLSLVSGLLVLLSGMSSHGDAAMLPPAEAGRVVAETIARVRREMNVNPEVVRYAFADVASALPGDRRMLKLAADVVSGSSNPKSVLYALTAVNDLARDAGRDYRADSANIFREATRSRNEEVRRYGAYYLAQLSATFKDEAYRSFKRQLVRTQDPLPIYQLMVQVFGESPDVLFFFVERARTSPDSATVQDALAELAAIMGRHGKNPRVARDVTGSLGRAFEHSSPAVQLNAAYHLSRLGGEQAGQARAFLERRLREPLGSSADAEKAKWTAVYRILRPLLDSSVMADKKLLVDAATANNLIAFYEAEIATRTNDSFNREYLGRWKALVGSGQK